MDDLLEGIGCVKGISCVEKLDIVTSRMLQAFVHGFVEPMIRFADPEGDTRFVLADDLDGFVFGCSVNDDVFDIRIGLVQYTQ